MKKILFIIFLFLTAFPVSAKVEIDGYSSYSQKEGSYVAEIEYRNYENGKLVSIRKENKILWDEIWRSIKNVSRNIAYAATALDSSSKATATGTSISFTGHTVAGTNRLLIAFTSNSLTDTPNNPTWNGDSMGGTVNSIVGFGYMDAYRLVAPDTGANTYSQDGFGSGDKGVILISFTGVDQTTPLGTWANDPDAGARTSASVTVTSATDDLAVDFGDGATDLTVTGGQTQQQEQTWTGTATNSVSTEAGAASVVMSYSMTSGNIGLMGVSVKADAVTTPKPRRVIIE